MNDPRMYFHGPRFIINGQSYVCESTFKDYNIYAEDCYGWSKMGNATRHDEGFLAVPTSGHPSGPYPTLYLCVKAIALPTREDTWTLVWEMEHGKSALYNAEGWRVQEFEEEASDVVTDLWNLGVRNLVLRRAWDGESELCELYDWEGKGEMAEVEFPDRLGLENWLVPEDSE